MSYRDKLENLGINLKGKTAGTIKTKCPRCANGKYAQDLSVNITEGLYKCHKMSCGWQGSVAEFKKTVVEEKKDYKLPVWNNNTSLTDGIVKWFANRKISQKTLLQMKISQKSEYMSQVQKEKNCICFNYFRDSALVNIKFRDSDKNFKLVSGAELILYNYDALVANTEIIIVEGEMDCLAYIECGINHVCSVPNGANSGSLKLEFLETAWQHFETKERVYIATDMDDPGIALKNELARRIGVEKCYQVDFKDCKDANDYLIKYGAIELAETIKNAKPFPIKGVIFAQDVSDDYNDLYYNGINRGKELGILDLDKLITWEEGVLCIVTGIPNQGKSEFIDYISCLLNIKQGWRFGVFSPENFPIKYHLSKLAEKIIGKRFSGKEKMFESEKDQALSYINKNYFFIRPDDEDYSLDTILEKARLLVLKFGIKALIIDPYNRLEHNIEKGVNETTYVSKLLDKLVNFKQKYGCTIFLIAHPRKINKQKNSPLYEVPGLYDISGSNNFFNKADIGITVYRNFETNMSEIYIQKVRFKHWGAVGMAVMKWNPINGRYTPDTENWISDTKKTELKPNIRDFTQSQKESYEEGYMNNLPF